MRVVIPCAGCGQRFLDAGYAEPKPLIRLKDGQRIIDHVIGMFPNDQRVFICSEHFPSWRLNEQIVQMAPHKRGPVFTVQAAYKFIEDDEPVIVAYCDGAIRFDREKFLKHVRKLDGCLFTHTGFHPHVLSSTKMAFIREQDGRVLEVKEKASFTDDPLSEHASSGVYYFSRGSQLKRYFDRALSETPGFNGEHYVTLVYNLMIADGLNVGFFDTPVAILGTPAEVENYDAWASILKGAQVRSEDDLLRCYRYWAKYHL